MIKNVLLCEWRIFEKYYYKVFQMHSLFLLFHLSSELLQHRIFNNTQCWFVLYPLFFLELHHQFHRMFHLLNLNWGLWFSYLNCLQIHRTKWNNYVKLWHKIWLKKKLCSDTENVMSWKYYVDDWEMNHFKFVFKHLLLEVKWGKYSVTEVFYFHAYLSFSMLPWRKLHIW